MPTHIILFDSLTQAVEHLNDFCTADDGSDVYMTAIVKAGEFCIETYRKTAAKVLTHLGYPYTGPKDIFKILYDRNVLNQSGLMVMRDFLEYRNRSAHKYGFDVINEIYPFIKEHYKILISSVHTLQTYYIESFTSS